MPRPRPGAEQTARWNANRRAKRAANPEYSRSIEKAWKATNPDCVTTKNARYHAANRERQLARNKEWRTENAERHRANAKAWAAANPERAKRNIAAWRAQNVDYGRTRYAADPEYRLILCSRAKLYKALQRCQASRSARTIELIGCSLPVLRQHIEAQFSDGMTWENQGLWHLDHKTPVCTFDLRDPAEQRRCFHFTNLQPLWAPDNLAKPRPRKKAALPTG